MGGPIRRLFMRYPWRISGLVGILIITGLRPCTRHIPEAPAVIAAMPAFSLTRHDGASVGPEQLRGEVWVAGFACATCEGPPADISATLASLSQRIKTHQKPLKVLAFASDAGSGHTSWHLKKGYDASVALALHGPAATIQSLKKEVALALESHEPDLWNRIFIIDHAGQLRGAYALGELGADEAYHRAQHVVRDAKIAAWEKASKAE